MVASCCVGLVRSQSRLCDLQPDFVVPPDDAFGMYDQIDKLVVLGDRYCVAFRQDLLGQR